MTTLTITEITMPAALIGPSNPFPQLNRPTGGRSGLQVDESVPAELRKYLGYGVGSACGDPCLPYAVQDNYGRERTPQAFKVAILENEHLRATILLEYGGRLWSLLHKATQRELVEVNPVFQPANLAIRGAWFSGGVEWNCGVRGHTALGCDPLFAAKITHPEGWPVLRLWEYERIRGVPFQMDFLLPPDSEFLHVRVGLSNPHSETIPLYWWSNIAVADHPGLRVVAPAREAIYNVYRSGLSQTAVPISQDRDITYSKNSPRARDFFFVIPDQDRPWIAALDETGGGIIHASTSRLRGRKLFVWGNSEGGKQWQKFLSDGHHPYVEIQAGVARTQYESFPMEAGSRLSWIESYGMMQVAPEIAHSDNWGLVTNTVSGKLEEMLPARREEELLLTTNTLFDTPPEKILQIGSGWGALESLRREACGETALETPGISFPKESFGQAQEMWLSLLRTGKLSETPDVSTWVLDKPWIDLLEGSADDRWEAWLHRGVMRYYEGNISGAQTAFETSLARKETAWALRNLGVLAMHAQEFPKAVELFVKALALDRDSEPLKVECVQALLAAGHYDQVLEIMESMPSPLGQGGRLRALRARAAMEVGQYELAETLLSEDLVVPDLREGERILGETWWELQARKEARAIGCTVTDEIRSRVCQTAPPPHLDFRQAAAPNKTQANGLPRASLTRYCMFSPTVPRWPRFELTRRIIPIPEPRQLLADPASVPLRIPRNQRTHLLDLLLADVASLNDAECEHFPDVALRNPESSEKSALFFQ